MSTHLMSLFKVVEKTGIDNMGSLLWCTKRLLVSFRSSLFVMVIYKCTKTLQLFTQIFTLNTNIFTNIDIIKNTYVKTQKLLKIPSSLKLGLN